MKWNVKSKEQVRKHYVAIREMTSVHFRKMEKEDAKGGKAGNIKGLYLRALAHVGHMDINLSSSNASRMAVYTSLPGHMSLASHVFGQYPVADTSRR